MNGETEMKKYKNSVPLEDVFCELFNDKEKLKDFLDSAFGEYIKTGDFDCFYRSLELVIKAQSTMDGFAKKINISKMGLYNVIKGKKEPKITTLVKIFNGLGYTLKVS